MEIVRDGGRLRLSRERVDANGCLDRGGQHGIDEQVLRTLAAGLDEMRDHKVHEPLCLSARDRGQDDEPRVKIDAGGELSEVIGIFRDDDPVIRDGTRENHMIGSRSRPRSRGWVASCRPSLRSWLSVGEMHSSMKNLTQPSPGGEPPGGRPADAFAH